MTPGSTARRISGDDFAPVPRRAGRARWWDARVIGGIVLVVAAVVVGARVVGASSRTAPVWATTRDLAAGTVLTADDLTSVQVNLGDRADRYVLADGRPDALVGHAVSTAVHGGELLPAGALVDAGNGRVLVIGVSAEHMPPGVGHGSRIDVYLTTTSSGAAAASSATALLAGGLTVQGVAAPSSGGLSGATSDRYQVSVLLEPTLADRLVRTLPTGDPIVVLVTGR